MTRKEKRQHWQEVVERWQGSGMSQVAWCRQEGVALASLRQWAAKLREKTREAAGFIRIDDGLPSAMAPVLDLELGLGELRARLPLAATEDDILKVLRALTTSLRGG